MQKVDTVGHSLWDMWGNHLCPFFTASRCQKPQLMEILPPPLVSVALCQFAATEDVAQQFPLPVNVDKVMQKFNKMHLNIN